MFKTIVVTTDLSQNSRQAFSPARAIAEKFGARLLALYVIEDRLPPFVDEFTAIPMDEIVASQRRRASEEFEQFLASEGGGPLTSVLAFGIPHVEILRVAEEQGADLIVMATHGGGWVSHAIFGSTTERVLRRASCPVLSVRAPGDHNRP